MEVFNYFNMLFDPGTDVCSSIKRFQKLHTIVWKLWRIFWLKSVLKAFLFPKKFFKFNVKIPSIQVK